MTIPLITAAPDENNPATIATEIDLFITEIKAAIPQMNTDIAGTNTNAATATAQAVVATAQATNASAAAVAAAAAASASAFAAGTYAQNACAISQVNFQTYRHKSATGTRTTDPANDSTNWVQISGTSIVTLSGDPHVHLSQTRVFTITNYDAFGAYSVSVTAGSVSLSGDQITFTAPASAQTVVMSINHDNVATQYSIVVHAGGLIGVQGAQGFGVGEYIGSLPAGFSVMTGHSDPASVNFGNYQYSDGSVLVFIPRFYYRIGNASSPRYATYGANAIDIVGIDTYATEAAANAAGYTMHRAFKDGGVDKSGFFIDKYIASKNGSTSCKSVSLGVPISLTTDVNYTNSNGMTGCTGIYADAITLSRARGAGFNCASVFMYQALALLALAHAQASSNTTNCAWYNATHNFPKGCNSGALSDANDAAVTFTSAGDTGSANKPKTGSGSQFAKTTHNGQSCGVADVNGAMYQVAIGITAIGSSATDTTEQADGNAYVLKSSVSISALTAGWTAGASGNDAFGDAAHLATLYDSITPLFPWGATGTVRFGNGSTGVFDTATSGTGWLRTGSGVQGTAGATSTSGTNQFGVDVCYRFNRANLFVLVAGTWSDSTAAGIFYRNYVGHRAESSPNTGFRASYYGD